MDLSAEAVPECYEDLILPESLVKLVMKACKKFEVSKYDQFAILDTLQYALYNNFKHSTTNEINKIINDQNQLCIMIINIIRITDKFNRASSKFAKEIDSIFKELSIQKSVYNAQEFEAFKQMEYTVKQPIILEETFNLISKYFSTNEVKNQVYDFSTDVLILFYCWKEMIYTGLQKFMDQKESLRVIKNVKMVAASVIFVVIKILNIPSCLEIFEKICSDHEAEFLANEANHLSYILFGLIKEPKT